MVHSHGELDESNGTVCEGKKKKQLSSQVFVFSSRPCVYYTYTEVWPSTDKRKMRKKQKKKKILLYTRVVALGRVCSLRPDCVRYL